MISLMEGAIRGWLLTLNDLRRVKYVIEEEDHRVVRLPTNDMEEDIRYSPIF